MSQLSAAYQRLDAAERLNGERNSTRHSLPPLRGLEFRGVSLRTCSVWETRSTRSWPGLWGR